MIIKNQISQVSESVGEVNTKKATINQDKMAKLSYLLTSGLYSDAISATLVEICNNGVDSVIESGKDPIENPVVVNLGYKDSRYFLSIQDHGTGMDKEFFEGDFMSILTSTKENDNKSIGYFGLGSKAFCSLKRAATFTIVKNGKKCSYLCYKGDEFIEYELLKEEDTTEDNGVLFELPINDSYEYNQFCIKAKLKLAYYDTVILIINGNPVENIINRTDLFQWSPFSDNSMTLCLKDVLYNIDWGKLGISQINIPISLRFGLDSGIAMTPNREQLLYSKETIQLIKDRVKEVAEFFVQRWNQDNPEYDNILKIWDNIGDTGRYVTLEDKEFTINDLLPYSKTKIEEYKVKGVELKTLAYYKSMRLDLLWEYHGLAYDNGQGIWKKKRVDWELNSKAFDGSFSRVIKVLPGLAGNVKEFLRDRHGYGKVYVTSIRERILLQYSTLLGLHIIPKEKWRDYIKEWQYVRDSIVNSWIDETQVEATKEYIEWLEDKKTTQKANRVAGIKTSNYEGLNKQKGEITLNVAREHKFNETVVFDKKVAKIEDLQRLGKLSILLERDKITEEFKEELFHIRRAFPKLQFVFLGEREEKHIKDKKNWITMDDLTKTKPFSRLATALFLEDILRAVPDNEELIYEGFPKYGELKKKLEAYKEKEMDEVYIEDDLKKIILDEARDNVRWDQNIFPEALEFQKIIRKFGFIDMIAENYNDTEEQKAIAKNMLYILLKAQKINHSLLEEMELVPKVPKEVYQKMEEVASIEQELVTA